LILTADFSEFEWNFDQAFHRSDALFEKKKKKRVNSSRAALAAKRTSFEFFFILTK
jgi:hypothetical protein